MKLKEWGYMRHRSRKGTATGDQTHRDMSEGGRDEEREGSADESDASLTNEQSIQQQEGNTTLLEDAQESVYPVFNLFSHEYHAESDTTWCDTHHLDLTDAYSSLLPMIDPWSQVSDVLMDMLAAVLASDSQELERLILANQNHINLPIGTPFNIPGGRFFNHPARQSCVMLEHPNQTLLDIACALPAGPVVWVLVANGANGSTHPLGTDLAFHNAIKNGRAITVQSLCFTNRSSVNGTPGMTWRPLLQAVFWNQPECVKILLDRGANVNDTAPMLDGIPLKGALQLALDRREEHYSNQDIRTRSEKCMKLLLDADADIHVLPAGDVDALTPWETFIKPFQSAPYWFLHLTPMELHGLQAFIQKGADLQVPLSGFPCSAPTCTTFTHQVLWHTTPALARLLIDSCNPSPGANGEGLLHEILGSCPDAKRHPSDTLRDIAVLLQGGADPNLPDGNGVTPLQICIDICPAVDMVARFQALLDGGADPEARYPDGGGVFARAARAFDEPLRSEVLHILVSKWKGRKERELWRQSCFPIQAEPSLADVLRYTAQNDGWAAEVHRLVPEDVKEELRKAAFSVVVSNFFDAISHKAKTGEEALTDQERDDLRHVVSLRHASALPPYQFDQDLVMALLSPAPRPTTSPQMSTRLVEITEHEMDLDVASPSSDTTITPSLPLDSRRSSLLDFPTSLGTNLPTPIAMDMDTPRELPASRRASESGTASDEGADFFFPTTTQIRWPKVDKGVKPGDLKKAAKRVLKYRCKSCVDGNLLTKAEYL
jgi:ankyrin repeat protein